MTQGEISSLAIQALKTIGQNKVNENTIDLAIDRKFFGFEGDISKTQIKKLRKQSCEFISTEFLKGLIKTLTDWGQ